MSKICGCCRQPIDEEPAGKHRGEPLCQGCTDELGRIGIDIRTYE